MTPVPVTAIRALTPAALTASAPPLESYDSVSPDWEEHEYRVELGSASVEAGYWTGSRGSVGFDSWPYNELCVILKGRVRVEAADGGVRDFGAGESFLIPQGFSGVWHTLEPTEKIFVGVHGG
jgi:uncharacterized cupin superfamily protein